ncbi:MAG: hypothetical protein AUJ92_17725 [Armatimonadetes bacterium CG2_30_59_28]|nr:hypothetical protein [Armatimonadota bacterium]OIO90871.1 MAG: hypothetical protein AUJ92_17725 [Armatimonadetes bacterium CG2_30_59_28]PIU63964.1 MAG: hypothetical protein COS85_14360 [Armatimonadetes bacterium CG07_land_8_20_14_0_80_59_28]PIX39430.1 MAG: hypothetical protein COZ56_17610 [Armatimonadetes bacterium CG_4_8_14_3_um_filter_58_9]PIY43598.1 MAG: hypothetical protein COZ05_10575 [Armatimonadetes bacterium CG_4_10_14_3_um_filter_59_10]
MTGREKIEAAMSSEGTKEFPAVVCYTGIFIRDHWDALTDCPWWYQFSPDLDRQLEWRMDVIEKTGQDWFGLPAFMSHQEREDVRLDVRPDGVYRMSAGAGGEEKLERPRVAGWAPPSTVQSIHPARPATTPNEIDRLIPAPVRRSREEFLAAGRTDLAARLLEKHGRTHYPTSSVASPLWHCYSVWGFEKMMTLVATRPDLVEYACQRNLAHCLQQLCEAAWLGVQGIWIEECLTDMIAPDAFARLNIPYVRRIVEEIRALGMHSIYYYCGDPAKKWDLILSIGADAISLEESKKGWRIDIEEVASRAQGRCAALGNIDAIDVLERGTDDQLRAEMRRQIIAGRRNGNRFILSLGSPPTPGTPVERVRRYCDLARELQQ